MSAPSYKTNDPRGWCGDPQRGAALGRPTIHEADPDKPIKLYLRRVYLNGDYDSNGTYFGCGGPPLYWYADANGEIDAMTRAATREQAKQKILQTYPNATFFR